MRHIALAVLVAISACKKSNVTGEASAPERGAATSSAGETASGRSVSPPGSVGGSAGSQSGSATNGVGRAAGSQTGSAAPTADFDNKLVLPKQPNRNREEQTRVDGAADALRSVLTAAKAAKDSAALCKAFEPLNKAMTRLLEVNAPKGIDQQVFSSQRSALLQLFDGASNWCDSPQNVGVDTLQDLMSDIRKQFVAFVSLGA